MAHKHDRSTTPRPRNWIIWLIARALVLVLVAVSLNGIIRGGGEALGVKEAAPGDDNASPVADSRGM